MPMSRASWRVERRCSACPPIPRVASTNRDPGAGSSRRTISSGITGRCAPAASEADLPGESGSSGCLAGPASRSPSPPARPSSAMRRAMMDIDVVAVSVLSTSDTQGSQVILVLGRDRIRDEGLLEPVQVPDFQMVALSQNDDVIHDLGGLAKL